MEIEVSLKVYGIASGFYNPLTVAHIQMLEASKALVDELIVIVNNDKQVELKGSIPFNTCADRLYIIRGLKCVDHAYPSVDEQWTIEKSIHMVFQKHSTDKGQSHWLFLNGGDRCKPSEVELEVCKQFGILTVYGVGGYDKPRSSSQLIEKAALEWFQRNPGRALGIPIGRHIGTIVL